MEAISKIIGAVVLIIGTVLLIAVLLAFPVMWLWNWLMPLIFGLTKITLLQALGLNILSGILIRSSSSSNSNK